MNELPQAQFNGWARRIMPEVWRVNSYSIVIPSRSITNLTACVKALRDGWEKSRIIVVWDGPVMSWSDVESWVDAIPASHPITWIFGKKPFIFARNCNIGIEAEGTDSIVLQNDDCLMRTPRGLAVLATQAHAHPEYGAICPGFDHCGTPNLINQGRRKLTEEKTMLVFACVFIPRSTIDRVGLLDERFGVNAGGPGKRGYGCDDDDYSLRIRQAGLKLGVYDPVLVHHTKANTGLSSTFRDDPEHPWDVKAHEELFRRKHGVHPRLQK